VYWCWEEELWATKNNALGLVTEDREGAIGYEDVSTRQIKLASMKMKTCHYWQNTTAAAHRAGRQEKHIIRQ